MISGFSNTSQDFPMVNELQDKTSEFMKYECADVFFDLLCPELNTNGIVWFFKTSFKKCNELIHTYFKGTENSIMNIGCATTLKGKKKMTRISLSGWCVD